MTAPQQDPPRHLNAPFALSLSKCLRTASTGLS
jgi:hypothetical protein